ncbi:hypothetical protein FAM09_24750 [Niastella caeni]|uniref:Uncharacterized protein n=1 Tax=Niastella caeni TaxID=2569763 RepID=A0A4S8HI75_9BACT|nr:hypothetical protein [Niastella caeni]THU34231.1 hypothetical protein FAM09_24750 [Niastella caeni]
MYYNNIYTPVQHLRRPTVRPGGLCWIVFALWQDVDLWPQVDPLTGLAKTPIALKAGKTWYECQVVDKGRIFNETEKKSSAGHYWEMQVVGYLGGNNSSNTINADVMTFNDYVVMFKDRDGQIRFLGNADTGAEVEFTYTSADNSTSRKRTINFTWQHILQAPIYVGNLDDILDDIITPPFAGVGDFNDDFSNDFNI